MQKPTRRRLGVPTRTEGDWEDAALSVIAQRGIAALSIPELAQSLGVTKGSFYWHFSSLDDLIARAIKRWEANDKATLDLVRQIADPTDRLRTLFTEAMSSERAQRLYVALALSSSPRVTAALRKVSERRLLLLREAYQELGMAADAAQRQALLTYSAYIGGLHLRRSDVPWLRSSRDLAAYVEHAAGVLVRPSRKKGR